MTMTIRRLPSLPTWPLAFRELDEVRREMDRLFGSLGTGGYRTAGVFPAINVTETGNAVLVRAELPGIAPDDLEITVEDNALTIAGERAMSSAGAEAAYHRREREWGQFRRSFSLPTRVDSGGVQARYRNGILTVELPKAAEARPKQIAVQTGS